MDGVGGAAGDVEDPRVRWGLLAILVTACFHAFWRLGRADWKVDESLDGGLAIQSVRYGRWIEDGHPVLVRWLFAAGQEAFGENRVGIRSSAALASVLAVLLLFVVGRALSGWRVGLLAAGLWAVLPRALVLGTTAVGPLKGDRYGYLEPFMVVALLGATLTGWRWVQKGAWRPAVITGLLVGVAVGFKPTAVVILVPIVGTRLLRSNARARVVLQGAAMGAIAVVVLFATYLPVGTDGPAQVIELFRYQFEHSRGGHLLVVDGELTRTQPPWSHLLYQWRGMGWPTCVALLVGVGGAWLERRRVVTTYLLGIWLTLLLVHVLSPVALPHYYLLWAPFSVLFAAHGLVALLSRRSAPHVEAAARTSTAPADEATPSPVGASIATARPPTTAVPATAIVPAAVTRGLAVAAVAVLAVVGLVTTVRVATIEGGDYGALATDLAERGVTARAVRFQGEAVERYFPGVVSSQVGFSDPSAPYDVLVLDPRDTPMVMGDAIDAERAAAAAKGLTEHLVGRLEVWYRDP